MATRSEIASLIDSFVSQFPKNQYPKEQNRSLGIIFLFADNNCKELSSVDFWKMVEDARKLYR